MDKAPADPQNAPADPQNAPADPQNAPGEPQNVLAIPQNVPDIPQNDQPSQGRVKKTLTLKLGATMQVGIFNSKIEFFIQKVFNNKNQTRLIYYYVTANFF